MLKVWAPALLVVWGCSDGGGSGNGRAGDGGASDASVGDGGRGDGGDLDSSVPEPVAAWSKSSLGSEAVMGFAAQGDTTWVLTAGAVHAIRGGQMTTEALPELAWPLAMHGRDGTVAAVGFDASGNSWAAVNTGSGWRTVDLPGTACPEGPDCLGVVGARRPGGVDVGADGVVRVPAFGVVTGLRETDGELIPYEEVTFSGNDELKFHTLRSFGAPGNWMFSGTYAMFANDLTTWSAFRQFGGALKAADAFNGSSTFLVLDTELMQMRSDSLDTFHRVVTPQPYAHLSAQGPEYALAAGPEGRLAVVGPRLPFDPQDLLAEGGLGLQAIDLGTTVELTAVLVAPDAGVWVGGADGTVWHFGIDAPSDWTPVEAEPVAFGDPVDPERPDGGVPDVDQGPPPDAGPPPGAAPVLRFVGLAASGGSIPCDGTMELGPAVGRWPGMNIAHGDITLTPGPHTFDDELSAAGQCRGLRLSEFDVPANVGGQYTAILGVSLALSPPVLTDDSTPGAAGMGRFRMYGFNRRSSDRVENVEYCVDGAPLSGGDAPRTGYADHAAGNLVIEVRENAETPCTGALRFEISVSLQAGEVRTIFSTPGTDFGPVKPEPDLLVVNCLDGADGVRPARVDCRDFFVVRQ